MNINKTKKNIAKNSQDANIVKSKPILDIVFGKLFSRKLLTFTIASVFLGLGSLTSTDWTLIACLYIGTQGAIDFYRIKNASGIGEPL